jgi:RNA polymerase sigma factor (sigma-70 family)
MQLAPPLGLTAAGPSDAELLERCADGEKRSLGALFDRYSRAVYAAAYLIVRMPADAEEVVSDAFFTLWRKSAGLQLHDGSALPWLITTARYLAMNRRRALRRDESLSLNDDIDTHTTISAEASASDRRLAHQLDRLIDALGPIDRQIVLLCLVNELSYDEAAERLGVSNAAVRNRLSRARVQLRNGLTSEGTQ